MKILPMALAAALSFSASMTLAEDFNAADMKSGLTMLETNAAGALKQYGVEGNAMDLTLAQLALISYILTDPDSDSGGSTVKSKLEAAVQMR